MRVGGADGSGRRRNVMHGQGCGSCATPEQHPHLELYQLHELII
jgi:hypothetical protein